jgi:hypothetical protein
LEGQSEVEVAGSLFLQFCGVAKLAIIHHKIQPNLAMEQTFK